MVRNSIYGLLLLALLLPFTARAQLPSVDTLLAQVAQATGFQAEHVRFRQDVQLRVLLLSWRFQNDIEALDGSYTVKIGKGAPGFMPDGFPAELLDVQQSIHLFDLQVVGTETDGQGRTFYIIEGVRKEPSEQGAQSGKLWIDGSEWYIAKAHLAYTWGKLEVEQAYRMEQGRRVLDTQSARLSILGARVEVKYLDYWFVEP